MPNILIRVDATETVALGHLKRCISLAQKLIEKNISVLFLITPDNYAQNLISSAGFDYRVIKAITNSDEDYNECVKTAKKIGTKIIIIDSYDINSSYRQKLMDRVFFLVSITDISQMDIVSHLIINGNLNAEKCKYPHSDGTIYCLGIEFLILGKDYWCLNKEIYNAGKISNVFITMGGVDHYNLTTIIIQLLDNFDLDFKITAIIGPYYDNFRQIKSLRIKKKLNLINSPPSLYNYMKDCSLAFSAGGQTLYELAALGRPTIGIVLWKNQAGNVDELSKTGAIHGVPYSKTKRFNSLLAKCVTRLIVDSFERKRMSKVASSLVDGKGAGRVSRAIIEGYNEWMRAKISSL